MQKFIPAKWLQIVSNIGVLIGVALVVLQLRQNTELLQFQITKQESDHYIETEIALISSDYPAVWAKMIENPQDLTLEDTRILDANLWSNTLRRWRGLYELSERGLLDEADWKRVIDDDIDFEFAYPYGRAYWQNTRDTQSFSQELVTYIDEKLAEGPYNFHMNTYEQQMNLVRKIQANNGKE